MDETVAKIKELADKQELDGDIYGFLTYLLGKEDLTYKDLSVITMSLFADGLSTVSFGSHTFAMFIFNFHGAFLILTGN